MSKRRAGERNNWCSTGWLSYSTPQTGPNGRPRRSRRGRRSTPRSMPPRFTGCFGRSSTGLLLAVYPSTSCRGAVPKLATPRSRQAKLRCRRRRPAESLGVEGGERRQRPTGLPRTGRLHRRSRSTRTRRCCWRGGRHSMRCCGKSSGWPGWSNPHARLRRLPPDHHHHQHRRDRSQQKRHRPPRHRLCRIHLPVWWSFVPGRLPYRELGCG